MLPINPATDLAWPPELAQAKLNEIVNEVVEELRARDESIGIVNGRVYEQSGNLLAVDRDLASLKSTGDEASAMIRLRWAEFCQKPRLLERFEEEQTQSVRKRILYNASQDEAKHSRAGRVSAVATALSPGPAPTIGVEPIDDVDLGPGASFECPECGKPCANASGLAAHRRSHASDEK